MEPEIIKTRCRAVTGGRARTCPDAESLAELIDGRSRRRERASLLGHFEQCPLCASVFVESHRFLHTTAPVRTRGATRREAMGFSFPKSAS